MNYQQQGNQLPFDHVNCMFQPMQFNQAPFVPNNLPIPSQFSSFVPTIATMVANEASSACNKNAGRMFLFNQLASNGYVNQDYVEAVQTAMDMLILGMVRGQYGNPNQGMSDAVSKSLVMCNAANFQKFPALQQYVQPDVYGDAVRIVNTLQGIRNDILQAKQQMSQMQQPQGMNNSGMGGGMQSNFPQQNNFPQQGNFPQQNMQGGFQQSRMQPGMPVANNSQIFRNSPQPQQSSLVVGNAFHQEGRYDNLRTNATPQSVVHTYDMPVNQTVPRSPNINQGSYFAPSIPADVPQQFVPSKELVWKPCEAQWHPATCDTRVQKLALREIKWADNNTYVVSVAINLTEEEMEEAKHKIGFTDQAIMNTTPERYGSRRDAIVDNIDAFVERSQKARNELLKEEPTEADFDVIKSPRKIISANFLAYAIFEGRVRMKKELQQTESDLSAYGINAIISTPVLVDDSQEKLLTQLDECKSFLRIQAIMKNALSSKSTSSVSKQFTARIDKLFTREINSVLNNKLSLDLSIECFVNDISDLISHLKNEMGEVIANAFLVTQDDFIDKYLNQFVVDEDMKSKMTEQLGIEIKEDTPNSQYALGDILPFELLTQIYGLTFLQVQSADLSISSFGKVGTDIILSNNPELFKLAKTIFDDEKVSDIAVAHQLLITADNVIYEFHKGLINKNFITISKFN